MERNFPEKVETDRLVLRPWTMDDAEALNLFARDPELGPQAGWAPHGSIDDSRRVLEDILMVPGSYAITLGASGGVVGAAAFVDIDPAAGVPADEPVIGFWVGKPFQNRGYATEALKALVGTAFEDLGAERVWSGYYEGNEPSAAVQEKAGFKSDHTAEEVPCSGLPEKRTAQLNVIDRDGWEKLKVDEAMESAMAQASMGMMGSMAAGLQGELDEP